MSTSVNYPRPVKSVLRQLNIANLPVVRNVTVAQQPAGNSAQTWQVTIEAPQLDLSDLLITFNGRTLARGIRIEPAAGGVRAIVIITF